MSKNKNENADGAARLTELGDGRIDTVKIDPTLIVINEGFNYRDFKLKSNKDHLKDTRASIRENGVLQPLWVRWDKELRVPVLIAGETRLRAVLEILADPTEDETVRERITTVPVIQKEGTEKDLLILSLQENTQKPPSQWEVGNAYRRLIEGDNPLTVEEIARRMGQTTKYVKEALALEDAPPELKQLLSEMAVTPSHVIATMKHRGGTATATIQAQVAAARKKAVEKAKAKEEKKAADKAAGKKTGRPVTKPEKVVVKRAKAAGGKFIKDAVLKLVTAALKAAAKSEDPDVSMSAETALEKLQEALKEKD